MEKLSKIALGVAVLALVVGGFAFLKSPTIVTNTVEKIVGGSTSNSAHQFFAQGVTVGGERLATTTGVTLATYTLTARELVNKTVISINPSVDLALKISASSTGQLVPNVGDTAVIYIKNASTTVASAITLSALTNSMDLNPSEVTGADLVLAGLNWGKLELIRNTQDSSTNSVTALFTEFVPD